MTVKTADERDWVLTGVEGFDELMTHGIPKGSALLISGGCGCGKTILSTQFLWHGLNLGEKCLYVSLEETPEKLREHMIDFDMDVEEYEKSGHFKISKVKPFNIARSVEGLLARAKGEIKVNIDEVAGLIPKGFKPNRIAIDSLSSLAAAFTGRDQNYRVYIEEMFDYMKNLGSTSFLISETEQVPTVFSRTGVEEFLADGVVILYNIRKGSLLQRAIEIRKLRGESHIQKVVPIQIQYHKGITVFPTEQVYDLED